MKSGGFCSPRPDSVPLHPGYTFTPHHYLPYGDRFPLPLWERDRVRELPAALESSLLTVLTSRGSLDEAPRNPGRDGQDSRIASGLQEGQVSTKFVSASPC